MAKKRITLEQAEGLMALGTARQEKPEEKGPAEEIPAGTRLHPRKKADEVQVSAYIHRDLHKAVKIALAEEETNFTALVTEFLKNWVQHR
ncbi:MAG: hypothetical protein EBR82_39705 [Caulobacteraceae bacterium]|nr:hypothetical protein [Caulobacteraceae bacterium]